MEKIKNAVLRIANSNPNRSFTPLQMAVIQKQLSLIFQNFQTPTHPTYASMIQTAIMELNEENGSNEESISEFIKVHYEGLPWAHGVYLSHHLNELCKKGELGFDPSSKCYSCVTSEGILFKGSVLGKNLPKKGFKKGREIIDDVNYPNGEGNFGGKDGNVNEMSGNLNGFQEEDNLECRESQSKRRRRCLVFEGDGEDRNDFVEDCDHPLTVGAIQENRKGVSSKVKDSGLKETELIVVPYKDNDTPDLAVSSGTNSISEGSSPMIVCGLVQPSKQQQEGCISSLNKSLEESQEKKKVSEKSMPTSSNPVDDNLVGNDQLDELSTQRSVDSKGVMQESEMESVWGSPWLMPMLKCHYFLCCSVHTDLVKSERNMFCLDCIGDAFCFNCLSHHDKDHRVVQIRKSSRQNAVRVDDIKMHLDISHIQPYIINSANIVYLNARPLPKTARSVSHPCETCGYSLMDSFRFCSLACKLHATLLDTSMIEESPVDQNQQVYCLEDGLKQTERHRCMDPLDPSSQDGLLRMEDEEHLPLQAFQKGKRKKDYAQIPTARERPPEAEINSRVEETEIHEQETDAGNFDSDAGPPGFVGTGHLMPHSLQTEPITPQNIKQQKRGRGRPRKDKGAIIQLESTQEEAIVLSNLPHREQEASSDLASIPHSDKQTELLKKRGPGRPWKQLESSSKQHITETKNKGEECRLHVKKLKKGRGRPRKQKEREKVAAVSKKLHIGERETQSESGIYLNLQKLAKKVGRGRPKKPPKGRGKYSGIYKKFHTQPDKKIRKNGRGRPRKQDINKEDSTTQLIVEPEQSKTDIQNSNPSDEMRKPEESLAEVHRKPETEQTMCPLDDDSQDHAALQQEVQNCHENKSKREDSENRSRPLKEKSTKSMIWVPLSSKDHLRSRINRKSQDNI